VFKGSPGGADGGDGGNLLYEAAIQLKDLLRVRSTAPWFR
jgi:GTPase involved in cell partitioning and DNA repair